MNQERRNQLEIILNRLKDVQICGCREQHCFRHCGVINLCQEEVYESQQKSNFEAELGNQAVEVLGLGDESVPKIISLVRRPPTV